MFGRSTGITTWNDGKFSLLFFSSGRRLPKDGFAFGPRWTRVSLWSLRATKHFVEFVVLSNSLNQIIAWIL